MKLKTVGGLLLVLVLTACGAAQGDQVRMQADMQQLKLRLADVERGMAALRDGAGGETTRQVADLQSGMDNLRVEFQSIAGRVDEIARENQQLNEELNLLRDEMTLKDSALEARLAALGKAPAAPAPSTPNLTPAAKPAVVAPAPSVTGAVSAPAVPAQGPAAEYEAALALIQQGKAFADGEKAMRNFLRDHSGHPLAVNAMYWVGEALYGQKKYEDSILQFQDVISQFADHPKAAAALLKQAIAFDSLGDRESGRATLQKLQARFPLSPEAERAKGLLAEWK